MNNVNIRHAIFDVDGTLIGSSHEVSTRLRRAIAKIQEQGVKTSLATGRALFAVQDLIKDLNLNGPCLTFSGAHVWDPITNQVVFRSALSSKDVVELCNVLRQEPKIHFEIYFDSKYIVDRDSDYISIHCEYGLKEPFKVSSIENYLSQTDSEVLKIEFMGSNLLVRSMVDRLNQEFKNLSFGLAYGLAHPDVSFVNITNINAARKSALDAISVFTGIGSSEVMAFGDAESDVPVLEWAGVGVAMGNAPQIVKDQANRVTRSVEEDGVACVLEDYFLNQN